ncbi:MAG: RNA polymerase sigma factor [Myxococcales bacterium]|nr:RNA polymerase sigma factor [Myxococcales bacterium]
MTAERRDVAQLFRAYGPLIYRRALRLLDDEALAEEALQDVFVRVIRAIDRYDDNQQALNWLYRITTNHCLNVIRGRKRRRAAMKAYTEAPRRTAARAVDLTTMRGLLSDADPQLALAAIYVHLDGMSYSEAAVHLEVSKRTVGNLIDRFNTWAQRRLEAT